MKRNAHVFTFDPRPTHCLSSYLDTVALSLVLYQLLAQIRVSDELPI